MTLLCAAVFAPTGGARRAVKPGKSWRLPPLVVKGRRGTVCGFRLRGVVKESVLLSDVRLKFRGFRLFCSGPPECCLREEPAPRLCCCYNALCSSGCGFANRVARGGGGDMPERDQ